MENNKPHLPVLLGQRNTFIVQSQRITPQNNAGNTADRQPSLIRGNAVDDLTRFNTNTPSPSPSCSASALNCLSLVASRICGK